MASVIIEAGRLRHVITVEVIEESDQDDGTVLQTATASYIRHASVEPLRGKEYWDAQQCKARVTHKVTTRYDEHFNRKCRITWGTRTLNVVAVINPEERNHMCLLMCEEVV